MLEKEMKSPTLDNEQQIEEWAFFQYDLVYIGNTLKHNDYISEIFRDKYALLFTSTIFPSLHFGDVSCEIVDFSSYTPFHPKMRKRGKFHEYHGDSYVVNDFVEITEEPIGEARIDYVAHIKNQLILEDDGNKGLRTKDYKVFLWGTNSSHYDNLLPVQLAPEFQVDLYNKSIQAESNKLEEVLKTLGDLRSNSDCNTEEKDTLTSVMEIVMKKNQQAQMKFEITTGYKTFCFDTTEQFFSKLSTIQKGVFSNDR